MVTAVTSAFIKQTYNIVESLCSHYNIEDGRKKQHFQQIILYCFKKGKNATEMYRNICITCRVSALTDGTCQKWFAESRAGDFLLDDAPHLGRTVEVDHDQTETLSENN